MGKASTKTRWTDLKATGRAFLQNSSMHGLKYIAEDDHNVLERLMWVFIFGVGVGASFYLCLMMWIKYDSSPSILTVETTDQPLSQVEFPSVTICSQNKISKRKLNSVMKNPRYSIYSMDDMILIMSSIIRYDAAINRNDDLIRLERLSFQNGISSGELFNLTLQTMVTCDDFLLDCQWKNQPQPCGELFLLRPTDDGLCCGFNHLEPSWPKGYNTNRKKLQLNELRRVLMPGIRTGLTVIVDADLSDMASSMVRSNGFKILITNAREFPDVAERGLAISPGFEFFAGLEAVSSHSAVEISRLPINKRGCYFESENILEFYTNYSMSRCLVECLTREMLIKCGCRPYYYSADATDRFCNLEEYICLNGVKDEFFDEDRSDQCSCLPMCDDFWPNCALSLGSFPGETFVTSRTAGRLMQRKPDVPVDKFQEYMSQNMAVLNVFYREPTGILYREDLRYGIEDFISAMGGALGLGFGFSFISAIEIFYFFVVRHYFSRRHRGRIDHAIIAPRVIVDQRWAVNRHIRRRASTPHRY